MACAFLLFRYDILNNVCIFALRSSVMAGHVSQLYVERFFPNENRQTALRMLGEIRDQVYGIWNMENMEYGIWNV